MTPVSAFSMYKKQTQNNSTVHKKKKKKQLSFSKNNVDNDTLETVALDLISDKNTNGIKKKLSVIKKKKEKLGQRKRKSVKPDLTAAVDSIATLDTSNKSFGSFVKSIDNHSSETEASPQQNFIKSTSFKAESTSNPYKPSQVFKWIIAPVKPSDFFQAFWEKGPLYIQRNKQDYYNQILTTEKLDLILRENSLFYTKNVDVVSYENGQRETHNSEGRAVPSALWDYYENGCSIRILNPQTYCKKLHSLLAALQEHFGCMAGVNVYLTPPGSQGFAPHYDDIEAFVLQLEGRKHWKLYSPLTDSEVLPRFSSKNLDRSALSEPIKEVTLEAGDLLYFPRGIIHEGFTDKDAHSLHITVSVYQRTAYVDLLEHMLKPALALASQEDIEFREGLPLQYLKHVGFANAEVSSKTRKEVLTKVKRLFGKLLNYISVDEGADRLGQQFMWDAMPPVPFKQEKLCMIHEDGVKMSNGKIYNIGDIHLDLKVRLLRYHCLRLVKEEEGCSSSVKIYYCTENANYYHGEEQQVLVVEETLASAVKYLVDQYPNYVKVKSLPLQHDDDKMLIVSDLWERGLIVTENPLETSTD